MSNFTLASYQSAQGPRAGIIAGGHLHDAAEITDKPAYASVLGILEDWDRAEGLFSKLAGELNQAGIPVAEAHLLAPLLYPGTIYCAGANYQDHMDAVAKHRGMPPQPSPRTLGIGPFFFLKSPRSVVGPGTELVNESKALDFEIELAVVIGRKARRVSAGDALSYVAGYTICNDLSARDRILRSQLPDVSPFKYDWGSHKNFDSSCPLGPWIVPAAAISDPQNLVMKTWVNDEIRQNSNSEQMIFSVAEQIEALTKFNTLYPGDIILTGTPAGVGAETSTWLKKGDKIRMEIAGIGEFTNVVA